MKITCLIVDDEQAARDGLCALCEDYPDVEVAAVCTNGMEAIDRIRELRPELILLDVQMPKINGFEVLSSLPAPRPQIIFVTAHDRFALKAFEVNAVDYLLKPFSDERFELAMQRAIAHIRLKKHQDIEKLIKSQSHTAEQKPDLRDSNDQRLVIKSDGCIHMIQKTDITHVEAFDYYVKIHVAERFYLIRETMRTMEGRLNPEQFMRIHKSHIVNRNSVKSLMKIPGGDYALVLTEKVSLKVSRSRVNAVKAWLR